MRKIEDYTVGQAVRHVTTDEIKVYGKNFDKKVKTYLDKGINYAIIR